jgi:hypothetical protein
MKTMALKLAFLGLLLALGAAAPWQLWHRAQLQARAKNEEFRRRAAALGELAATNARLADLVAQASKDSLSIEQFHELLRLRGDISPLRRAADEAEKLRARNAQLASPAAPPPPPDPQTVLAHWPKDQLLMAGYANPIAAVETTLWAISRNDPVALAASVAPEIKSSLTREDWQTHGPPEEETAKATQRIADSLNPATGFYVVGQEVPGSWGWNFGKDVPDQDQATVQVYFDGEGQTRKLFLERVAGEWKFVSLGGAWP